MEKLLCPSMMCADYGRLAEEIKALDEAGVDIFHCDIMDSTFVPNITMGLMDLKTIRKYTKKPVDVHLMIDRPVRYVEQFCDAGADLVTVHVESDTEEKLHDAIARIHAKGKRAGVVLQKRFRLALFNPLLLSVIVTILVLVTAHIDYEVYYAGAKYLSYLLTPATVCLAVPLYEKFALLRSSWRAILAGILSGVLTTLCSVLALSLAFRLSHEEYVTLLPKSITTAIGMGVSEELGGYVTLTVAMIIITGILGNVIAVAVCRVFRITEPIAKGVAIGSAAHALGTAKAIEIGEVEGAMSGLSIVVAGLLTVVGASVFANFL